MDHYRALASARAHAPNMGGPGLQEASIRRALVAEDGSARATDTFFYSAQFLPLASGATASFDINIQADSDFLIMEATGASRDPAAGNALDPDLRFLIQIIDSGSGRQLFDRAQDAENVLGVGRDPYVWPIPKPVYRASTLTVTVQDLRGRDSDVRVSFSGPKVFLTNMGM